MKNSVSRRIQAQALALGSQFSDLPSQVRHPGVSKSAIFIQSQAECVRRKAQQRTFLGGNCIAVISLAAKACFSKEASSGALKHYLGSIAVTANQPDLTDNDRKDGMNTIADAEEIFTGRQVPGLCTLTK